MTTDSADHDVPAVVPDRAARDRIATELESTLFVEAGAGSGKTTALITRVLSLVRSGTCELEAIAAITFTDKAAAELRDRLRRAFEEAIAATETSAEERPRRRRALEQLDGAAIGTLHSFAQRILTEHPVEAGLPPRVEVVDEVSSDVAFGRRWATFRDELLVNPDVERSILLLVASGVKFDALRLVAIAFNDNWDLADERVPAVAPEPPRVHHGLGGVLDHVAILCAEECTDPDDRLRLALDAIAAYVAELRTIDDELDLMEALDPKGSSYPSFKVGNRGRKGSWACDVKELQERVRSAGEQLDGVRTMVANVCLEHLAGHLRSFTLTSVEERRRAGQLEFHDLLVLACRLLRDPVHGAVVRRRLHERYERLLLDEFQDTDPIQIELAVRIASAEPEGVTAGTAPWHEVEITPGHLFFVGDPKQSIYRFRRADISMFLTASRRFGGTTHGVELTSNFRTVGPVIEWINAAFGRLIIEADTDELGIPSQPPYAALDATRPTPPIGPPVGVIGTSAHGRLSADAIRAEEAADVVSVISQILHDGWSVDDGSGGWRPAQLGDVTILVPARTSLPFLEDALDGLGIPYRAESSSLVYASRAVRDLLMVLRAIADPTNLLHTVAALRTALFACGDDDLFRFKAERGGRWSYLATQPDSVPAGDPVAEGLRYLRSLYLARHWLAPSELLDRVARDRRAMDLGFAEGRPRDVWRRLRFVIDQARAWSEATGGNLRQYLSWIALQTQEGARVAEAVLPETDDDAVRIMTIHSAKGLEFPITIVSGMSTAPQGRRAQADVVFPPTGGVGYRLGQSVRTDEYDDFAPIDEQMSLHERIRLLYVACTRARDHLVVSVHRKGRATQGRVEKPTNAELLLEGMEALEGESPPDLGAGAVALEAPAVSRPAGILPFHEWEGARHAALQRSSMTTTVSATSLTEEGEPDLGEETEDERLQGLGKRPRDLDLPPWLKGRYGSAVGRAVHGVLQTIDLESGDGLEAAVAAQCEAEAITDRADAVRQLVTFALASSHVRNAATGQHWRELYVCVPIGERLLEGYIDLLYRSPDGLVVVDYKTSSTSDPEESANRVAGYTTQGASYALAVSEAVGEPVVSVGFVFLTPHGPVEIPIDNLEQAIASVRTLMAGPV